MYTQLSRRGHHVAPERAPIAPTPGVIYCCMDRPGITSPHMLWRLGPTSFLSRSLRTIASMPTLTPAPTFKPFNLALIQLGQIGPDKTVNLKHARDMIRKAASGNTQGKPDLIVLPVSASRLQPSAQDLNVFPCRNALIRRTGICTFPFTPSQSGSRRERNMMSTPARARV